MPTRETPAHSPAPFRIASRGLVGSYTLHDAQGNYLALLDSTSEADDRLILKAPDLLAVCRAFCVRYETRGELRPQESYATMKALVDHIDGGGE